MSEDKNKDILTFLLSRRSDSAQTLKEPAPDWNSLQRILTAAARTPDHGKLVPWRFLVLKNSVMSHVAKSIIEIGKIKGLDEGKLLKNANTFLNSPLIVAVVSSPKSVDRIPLIEQQLSAGAVCLALLNAAQAGGWGANWLTGWMSYDKSFLSKSLGLSQGEFVAGFIHIGTKTVEPVSRQRPDLDQITTWLEF